MYLTVKESAEYLELPEKYIHWLIEQGKVRALYDGEQYLLNKEQFNQHIEQIKKLEMQMKEVQLEPIPEDYDVQDED